MSRSKISISVFFPCYNDEKTIGRLVNQSDKILKKLKADYEIIVIDDGSSDGSREILKKLSLSNPRFRYIFHKKNKGYGGALKSGFKAATKKLVFYTDGDAQYDVNELPILIDLMTDDVNIVNGIKMERQDYAYRVILGQMYALIVRWMFLLPIYDVDCDFRLIRKELLDKFKNKLESDSGAICTELVKRAQKAGGKFRQVSVHHLPREFGESQFFKLPRLIATFKEMSGLWFKMTREELKERKIWR